MRPKPNNCGLKIRTHEKDGMKLGFHLLVDYYLPCDLKKKTQLLNSFNHALLDFFPLTSCHVCKFLAGQLTWAFFLGLPSLALAGMRFMDGSGFTLKNRLYVNMRQGCSYVKNQTATSSTLKHEDRVHGPNITAYKSSNMPIIIHFQQICVV